MSSTAGMAEPASETAECELELFAEALDPLGGSLEPSAKRRRHTEANPSVEELVRRP